MTVVYLDRVWALNTAVDYLLLLGTARLSGLPLRRGWLLLWAAAGGAYAAAVFLPGAALLGHPLCRLAVGLAMALGAFRGSWRQAALFFLLAGGLAGVVLALGLMAGSPLGLVRRVYYADVSWPLLLAASMGGYAALHLLFGQGARHGGGELLQIKIVMAGRTQTVTALHDTGNTLRENVKDAKVYLPDVIHTLDNPVMTEPGIGVLYGNLAPEGAIIKIAAVPANLMTGYRGKARVFDTLDASLEALRSGKINPGDACVVRFLGMKARFGTTAFTFQEELKGHHELFNSCAVITDGRFSGGSSGLSVGYVSPEAALGGPLGVVKEGDEIEIDVLNRRITLCISDEEMAKRISEFHWEFPASNYQRYLRLFVKNVGSMAQGCVWDC